MKKVKGIIQREKYWKRTGKYPKEKRNKKIIEKKLIGDEQMRKE